MKRKFARRSPRSAASTSRLSRSRAISSIPACRTATSGFGGSRIELANLFFGRTRAGPWNASGWMRKIHAWPWRRWALPLPIRLRSAPAACAAHHEWRRVLGQLHCQPARCGARRRGGRRKWRPLCRNRQRRIHGLCGSKRSGGGGNLDGAPGLAAAPPMDVKLDAQGNQLWAALDGYGVYSALAPHRLRDPSVVSAADMIARTVAPGRW